jgi:hypothetical protein
MGDLKKYKKEQDLVFQNIEEKRNSNDKPTKRCSASRLGREKTSSAT